MPDRSPDQDDVGDAAPASGARRSGLDRLRAARGGAPTAPAEQRTTERAAPADAAVGSSERSGSTALLETPQRTDPGSDASGAADSATDAGTAAELTPEKAGATDRRRLRRRGASTKAATGSEVETGGKRDKVQPTGSVRRPPSWLQVAAVVVLTLLIIGLLVPVVLMRHRIVGQSKDEKAITNLVDKRTDAAGFARRFAVTFFSPDYKTIDNYNNQVSAQTTGDFKKDFDGKRGQLKSLLTQVQSQASGRVLAAGVSKVSGNNVEVLVVADQDVKNATTKGKTVTNRYRVRLTLLQTDKGWLVQGLEPVI